MASASVHASRSKRSNRTPFSIFAMFERNANLVRMSKMIKNDKKEEK